MGTNKMFYFLIINEPSLKSATCPCIKKDKKCKFKLCKRNKKSVKCVQKKVVLSKHKDFADNKIGCVQRLECLRKESQSYVICLPGTYLKCLINMCS